MLMRLDNVLQGHPSVCQPLNILENFWIVVLIALQIVLLATSILCQILADVGNISAVKIYFVVQISNSTYQDLENNAMWQQSMFSTYVTSKEELIILQE